MTSSSSFPVPGLPTQSVKVPPRFADMSAPLITQHPRWGGANVNCDPDSGHLCKLFDEETRYAVCGTPSWPWSATTRGTDLSGNPRAGSLMCLLHELRGRPTFFNDVLRLTGTYLPHFTILSTYPRRCHVTAVIPTLRVHTRVNKFPRCRWIRCSRQTARISFKLLT
jgi:hypothetical protein